MLFKFSFVLLAGYLRKLDGSTVVLLKNLKRKGKKNQQSDTAEGGKMIS